MSTFIQNITVTLYPVANGGVLRIPRLLDGKDVLLELNAAELTELNAQITVALAQKLVDSADAIIEQLKKPPAA